MSGRWYQSDLAGKLVDLTTPYRIGWRSRYHPWRFRRPWQSESGNQWFARRAFTAAGAQRKMLRDGAYSERMGRRSLYQRWRWWRAQKTAAPAIPVDSADARERRAE